MGRIYREAESVVVWLGQMSTFSEHLIPILTVLTGQETTPSAEVWNCSEDQIISTGAIAGIPASVYKFAILGAATITWSQWYALSIPERVIGHYLTSHVYTKVHTDVGCTGALLGQAGCLPYRRNGDKR